MILNLQNIYKNYSQGKLEVSVLKDVSLQVQEGEYVAILGPSGSGKTTLMNIIGCLDKPTSGTYTLAEKDILRQNDREMARTRNQLIGFVFQNFNLLPRQTALENVELPLVYALVRVGLEERISFQPTQLSGGQQQRVAIARAIANHPKVLLADEPTGALDTKSGEQVMELFHKLNEEGVTIVMITHESAIADHARRILSIRDGEIVQERAGGGAA